MKKEKQKRDGRVVSVDEYFDNLSEAQSDGLASAALEIAESRAQALREIRDLLLANEDEKALKLMRKYLGIC
jgi:hypothetical protein